MVTFRSNNNNNRRPTYRNNNSRRSTYRGNDGSKFSHNDNFQRKVPGRNNHNASNLIEKYNNLAREALAQEDKILSENYFQHADHFTRVQNEQESNRAAKTNSYSAEPVKSIETEVGAVKAVKTDEEKEVILKPEIKKVLKNNEKKSEEKKSVAS